MADDNKLKIKKKKRGRPVGYKLSEESKKAISESKKGQHHSVETREKISRSLKIYFNKLNPLSSEIKHNYRKYGKDTCRWIDCKKQEINDCKDIMTDRSIRNTNKIELAFGEHIERFSHEFTPEAILLFKEECYRLINKGLCTEEDDE